MQLEFDSQEEYLFSLWLESVSEYVERAVYHPEPYTLFDGMMGLQKHKYTADWLILWKENAVGVLYVDSREKVPRKRSQSAVVPFIGAASVVDIKGGFVGRNNSSGITFPLNQKWMMDKFGIYVNKTVISFDKKGLFYRTFVPENVKESSKYVRTGLTKFKYETRTFDEYLKLIK